eukprot:2897033-Rhodomonas_salina.2
MREEGGGSTLSLSVPAAQRHRAQDFLLQCACASAGSHWERESERESALRLSVGLPTSSSPGCCQNPRRTS